MSPISTLTQQSMTSSMFGRSRDTAPSGFARGSTIATAAALLRLLPDDLVEQPPVGNRPLSSPVTERRGDRTDLVDDATAAGDLHRFAFGQRLPQVMTCQDRTHDVASTEGEGDSPRRSEIDFGRGPARPQPPTIATSSMCRSTMAWKGIRPAPCRTRSCLAYRAASSEMGFASRAFICTSQTRSS